MPITISGNGDITGLPTGWLPDGIVTPSDLSTGGPYWNSSGQLAVGNTSPGARLNISEGNTNAVSTTSTDVNRVLLTDTSGSTSAGVGYSLDFEGIYGGLGRIAISKSNSNTTGTTRDNGAFRLFLNQNLGADSYAAFTEAVTIDSGGTDQGLIYRFRGTEQFRVDNLGRLLLGTSSFTGDASLAIKASSAGAATQSMLILQRGASLPAPDAVLGEIKFTDGDASGRTGALVSTEVDGSTWTASSYPTRLIFKTTGSGASSPTERMRISSTGQISSSTSSSAGITGAGAACFVNNTSTATSGVLGFCSGLGAAGSANNTNCAHFTGITQGVSYYYLYGNGTSSFTSDSRKKKNIETTRDGYLEDLSRLRVVKYNWINQTDGDPKELGLIAQEVEKVFPGLVQDGGQLEGDDFSCKVLKGSVLPFMLLKALQEAAEKIETLEARLTALETA